MPINLPSTEHYEIKTTPVGGVKTKAPGSKDDSDKLKDNDAGMEGSGLDTSGVENAHDSPNTHEFFRRAEWSGRYLGLDKGEQVGPKAPTKGLKKELGKKGK